MPRKTKESNNKKSTIKDLLLPKKRNKSTDTKLEKEKTTDTAAKKESTKKTISRSKPTKEKSTTKKTTTQVTDKATKDLQSSKNTKKASAKSISSKSKSTAKSKKVSKEFSPEYYDLPFKYNKTMVKILAQTPTNLFIYWEIADDERNNLKQQYGKYFFEITKPVLIIHNETLNYSFEIDIDDFANSWYLHVNDSNCEYKIELGRRPIPVNYNYIPQYNLEKNGPIAQIETPYIYITSSNQLEMPNDHILFNKQDKVYFRNVKTNEVIEKNIEDFPFISQYNHFIHIYEVYKDLYKEELLNNRFDLNNPSSGNPSSSSFSYKFR